jgi:hypothetical protein
MNADDWLLLEEMEFYIRFINKATGKVRYVDKLRFEIERM